MSLATKFPIEVQGTRDTDDPSTPTHVEDDALAWLMSMVGERRLRAPVALEAFHTLTKGEAARIILYDAPKDRRPLDGGEGSEDVTLVLAKDIVAPACAHCECPDAHEADTGD